MEVHPSELRKSIYNLLDQIIKTGIPLEIKREGHKLKIAPSRPYSKSANFKLNLGCIIGDPEELIDINWNENWKPEI